MSDRHGLRPLSTGAMLRTAVEDKTDIGLQVAERMSSGDLVPDELIINLVMERIAQADCQGGVILDGFPRTIVQAREFDRRLAEQGQAISMVILFEADDLAMVQRISGRFACARCGTGYHDTAKPLKREDTCDVCGGHRFTRRADDNPETVRHRLEDYHALTEPLIPYYRDSWLLRSIDAMASMDSQAAQIDELFAAT
jgi:adenylate kinase